MKDTKKVKQKVEGKDPLPPRVQQKLEEQNQNPNKLDSLIQSYQNNISTYTQNPSTQNIYSQNQNTHQNINTQNQNNNFVLNTDGSNLDDLLDNFDHNEKIQSAMNNSQQIYLNNHGTMHNSPNTILSDDELERRLLTLV